MRTEIKGALQLALPIVLLTVLVLSLSSACPASAAPDGLTPHAPIYINGNDNFTPANGVVGGRGTENDPYIIENWVISAENAHGIWVEDTTAYFVIRNCVAENGGEAYYRGIYFGNVMNGRIDNNTCENNYYDGILLYSSDNNMISNNTCSNNNIGIYLISSSNNTISNNTCENNEHSGIFLVSSSNYNILENNTCENNYRGILLYFSDNNTIENNTCKNNEHCIFFYGYSDNNTITNNTCVNNSWDGIHLGYHSDNNRVYHNNIINNPTQAYDEGSNYWDDGYPSGGNYWSDYTGVDENHGENQDIPGSDGIGDTPYDILGDNNQDRYPLMNPWSPPEAIFTVSPAVFTVCDVPPLGEPWPVPQNITVWNGDNVPRTVFITTELPPENMVTPGYDPIPNENWVIPYPSSILIEENSFEFVHISMNIPRRENLTGQKWEVWIPVERQPLPGEVGVLRPTVRMKVETTEELPPPYQLTTSVNPSGSGSIVLDPPGGTYDEGTEVTATANPASGYEFDHWSGDTSGTSTSVTITMDSDKIIIAHFTETGGPPPPPPTNEPPTACFTYSPSEPTTEDTIQFTDQSTDNDGSIVSWSWDFDDGTTSTEQNPTHSYDNADNYTVSLTVTDDDGATDNATKTIEVVSPVVNQPPTADTDGPYSVDEGKTIELDGTGSSDPDGIIVSYSREITDDPTEEASLTGPNTATPVFHAPSVESDTDVTVKLTVEDNNGATGTDTAIVTVHPAGVGPPQYELSTSVIPPEGGTVTLNPPGGIYEGGTEVTVTAEPADNYEFDHWSGDVFGTSTSITLTMDSDKSVTAYFRSISKGEEGLPLIQLGLGITVIVIIAVVTVIIIRRP